MLVTRQRGISTSNVWMTKMTQSKKSAANVSAVGHEGTTYGESFQRSAMAMLMIVIITNTTQHTTTYKPYVLNIKLYSFISANLNINNNNGQSTITGVFSKSGFGNIGVGFNAIEFYAVGQGDCQGTGGDWCDYILGDGNTGFSIGPCTPFAIGDFWRITDNQTAFSDYFGVTADYEVADVSIFDGTEIVDLFSFLFQTNVAADDQYGDSTSSSWNYVDGWAYRDGGTSFGTFDETNWDINQGAVPYCLFFVSCTHTTTEWPAGQLSFTPDL